MKVLLTGFSGFLGRRIARSLIEQGVKLRVVLNRRTLTRRECAELGDIEVVWGGIDQPSTIAQAVAEMDVVVHSAWAFSRQGDKRPTSNETGTKLLFDASVQAGVQRFVFISSVAVYGMKPGDGLVTEAAEYAKGMDAEFIYPSEKVGLEEWLRRRDRRGTALVVFRPGPIFDERKGPVKKILRLGGLRLGMNFGHGKNHMAFIHVGDCADAVAKGALAGKDGAVYNIVPSQQLEFREWIRVWGLRQNTPLSPLFVRGWVLRIVAWGANRLKRVLKKPGSIDVSYALAAASRDVRYSNQSVKEDLAWTDRRTEEYSRLAGPH